MYIEKIKNIYYVVEKLSNKIIKRTPLSDIIPTGSGSGDMLTSIYDPTSISNDAFDMENMVEGATNKIMSSTERTKLQGINFDGLNKITVGITAPSTPTNGDLWVDIS